MPNNRTALYNTAVCTTILVKCLLACVGTFKLNCVVASHILHSNWQWWKYEQSEMKGKQPAATTTTNGKRARSAHCGWLNVTLFFCFFLLNAFNESKWKSAFCFKLRRYSFVWNSAQNGTLIVCSHSQYIISCYRIDTTCFWRHFFSLLARCLENHIWFSGLFVTSFRLVSL